MQSQKDEQQRKGRCSEKSHHHNTETKRYNEMRFYKDDDTLEEIIASNGIFPGYVDKDGRILVAYKIGRRRVGYRELILSKEQTRKFSGCWFAELESAKPIFNAPEMKQEVVVTVASYIVLLPMRDENYVRRNCYYVVTHNWEERNSNGEFKVPDINEMHNYHQDEPQRQHPQPGSEHKVDDDQSLQSSL
jgi:hypothetical protein